MLPITPPGNLTDRDDKGIARSSQRLKASQEAIFRWKSLPHRGSSEGKCEVNPEIECAWQQIYDRLEQMGKLEQLAKFEPPKDWSVARDGGVRRMVRGDIKLQER